MRATQAAIQWGFHRPTGIAALCVGSMRLGLARGAMRKPLYRLLDSFGPVYDIEVSGLKFRCRVAGNLIERRLIGGQRRLQEVDLVTRDLAPGDTFVDVGANCGVFSLYAAKAVGPSGRVLAVEPSPSLVTPLRFNVQSNGFQNIDIVPVAVGDDTGTATLHVVSRQQGRSSLYEVAGSDLRLMVSVEPLLSVLTRQGIARIHAMKIDIEGYEDRALLPFFATAPREMWPRRR